MPTVSLSGIPLFIVLTSRPKLTTRSLSGKLTVWLQRKDSTERSCVGIRCFGLEMMAVIATQKSVTRKYNQPATHSQK